MVSMLKYLGKRWKGLAATGLATYFLSGWMEGNWGEIVVGMEPLAHEASVYGKTPLKDDENLQRITMIVNPNADKKNGKKYYEKYAASILNLSGFLVDTVKTNGAAQARNIISELKNTDIIGVAGGDGTLMEVMNALLRRQDAEEAVSRYTLGLIPTGTHNNFGTTFLMSDAQAHLDHIAESAIVIARQHSVPTDVVQIDVISDETNDATVTSDEKQENGQCLYTSMNLITENPLEATLLSSNILPIQFKAIPNQPTHYSMSGIEMGRFSDAIHYEDQMWRFINQKARIIWSNARIKPVKIQAELRCRVYCYGCSKCKHEYNIQTTKRSHFQRIRSIFLPPAIRLKTHDPKWDTSNPECGMWKQVVVNCSELNIKPKGNGLLEVQIGKDFSNLRFCVSEALNRRHKFTMRLHAKIYCQELQFLPINTSKFFYVDNEEFMTKPIHIKVLRDKVKFYKTRPLI